MVLTKGKLTKMGQRKEMDFTFGMMGQHTKEVLVRTKDTAPELSGGLTVKLMKVTTLKTNVQVRVSIFGQIILSMKERFYEEQGIVLAFSFPAIKLVMKDIGLMTNNTDRGN